LLKWAEKIGIEIGLFVALHTYGRQLNQHTISNIPDIIALRNGWNNWHRGLLMALLRFRKIIKKSQAGNFRDSGASLLWLKNVLSVRFRTIGLQTPGIRKWSACYRTCLRSRGIISSLLAIIHLPGNRRFSAWKAYWKMLILWLN
ncbi:hypothetical protein, partial [Morganella sp. EGD-HP17]|uniref:hypothetical protein n=1 Tax=Morganella sp. EGD-HP17 TaxID=1435146 RepID=UPI001C10FEAC